MKNTRSSSEHEIRDAVVEHQRKNILDGRLNILIGDVFDGLRDIQSESVDCIVTSPPYWGLRDYGVEGQLGLEPTLDEHMKTMVAVFNEAKRILKPAGTVWVNYGACYATTPNGRSAAATKLAGKDDRTFRDKPFSTIGGVLKHKDLCMLPNRLAVALQDAGWWVRSEIIWAKPNPMPESVKDRPANSHEKIFMLTKSPRYFYDNGEVRQGLAKKASIKSSNKTISQMKAVGGGRRRETAPNKEPQQGFATAWDAMTKNAQCGNGRNLHNYGPAPLKVWNIANAAYSEAHFATFPPELAERCIIAGCPKGGLVLDPFGGAGTTALVALRHGRRSTLIKLNPEYAELAERRILKEWRVPPKPINQDFGPLFSTHETGDNNVGHN